MTSSGEKLKQITVRWPLDFWKAMNHIATDRMVPITKILTELAAKEYGLPMPNLGKSGQAKSRPRKTRAA